MDHGEAVMASDEEERKEILFPTIRKKIEDWE